MKFAKANPGKVTFSGAGKFVELNDYWYWGLAFTNGSQAGHVSYSNRNGANNIHKWVSPSTSNGSYKLHIITNGGGGGGGRSSGSGGGAGGMTFFYNRSNLANTEFEFEVGARGSWGGLKLIASHYGEIYRNTSVKNILQNV